jgi:hypothetical protein
VDNLSKTRERIVARNAKSNQRRNDVVEADANDHQVFDGSIEAADLFED